MIFNARFRCGNMLQAFESDSKTGNMDARIFLGDDACNTPAVDSTEAFCSCSSIEKQTDWTVDKRSYKILFELLLLELLDIFTYQDSVKKV